MHATAASATPGFMMAMAALQYGTHPGDNVSHAAGEPTLSQGAGAPPEPPAPPLAAVVEVVEGLSPPAPVSSPPAPVVGPDPAAPSDPSDPSLCPVAQALAAM